MYDEEGEHMTENIKNIIVGIAAAAMVCVAFRMVLQAVMATKWGQNETVQKLEKFSKAIYLVVLVVFCGYLYITVKYVGANEEYILAVKNTTFSGASATVEAAFNDFYGEQNWSSEKTLNNDKNIRYVSMNGKCYYDGNDGKGKRLVDVEWTFEAEKVRKDTYSVSVEAASVNNDFLDEDGMMGLLEDTYLKNIDISSMFYGGMEKGLSDFGDLLGRQMMKTFAYGKYYSFYSETTPESEMAKEETHEEVSEEVTEKEVDDETVLSPETEETVEEVESPDDSKRAYISSYTGNFPIDSILDTTWVCRPDELTESHMKITKNDDGSVHLSIEATSTHNPYVNNFEGDSIQITATEKEDLFMLFASDGTDENDTGDNVIVTWTSEEAIDFPSVTGEDQYISYLYDGDYSYEGSEAITDISYITMFVVNCNESITLRTSPSTSSTEICQIPLGASVSYISSDINGFYKIAYQGKTGYALAAYLSETEPELGETIYYTMRVVNCNESITLRTSPSTSASEICQIPLWETVSYIETAANGFYKISYLGKTGYALASYLEFQ